MGINYFYQSHTIFMLTVLRHCLYLWCNIYRWSCQLFTWWIKESTIRLPSVRSDDQWCQITGSASHVVSCIVMYGQYWRRNSFFTLVFHLAIAPQNLHHRLVSPKTLHISSEIFQAPFLTNISQFLFGYFFQKCCFSKLFVRNIRFRHILANYRATDLQLPLCNKKWTSQRNCFCCFSAFLRCADHS